jgi:hypothetical protein
VTDHAKAVQEIIVSSPAPNRFWIAALIVVLLVSGLGADKQVPATGSDACKVGTSPCANTCVNLNSDSNNCGRCDRACAIGETCSKGSCQASTQGKCKAGRTTCNGKCVDLSQDDKNCGTCNNACGGEERCVKGACVSTAESAPSAFPSSSPRYPYPPTFPRPSDGEGGGFSLPFPLPGYPYPPTFPTPTPAPSASQRSGCPAPTPVLYPPGSPAPTPAPSARPGNDCPPPAPIPEPTSTGSACGLSQTSCMGRCLDRIDLLNDPNNCGSCGNLCSIGESCQGGSCRRTFPCRPGEIGCH